MHSRRRKHTLQEIECHDICMILDNYTEVWSKALSNPLETAADLLDGCTKYYNASGEKQRRSEHCLLELCGELSKMNINTKSR